MKTCYHNNTKIELLYPGHVHHAKMVCTDCGLFVKWVSEKEIQEYDKVEKPPKFKKLF